MKILFVNRQLDTRQHQGTERYVITLSRALRCQGHDVVFLVGAEPGERRARPWSRVGDAPGPTWRYPDHGWLSVRGVSPGRVGRWLETCRPDVLHLANPAFVGAGILEAARSLGIRTFSTVMDFWWVCPKSTLLRGDGTVCDGTPGWSTCVQCMVSDHARPYARWMGQLPRVLAPLPLVGYWGRAATRGMPSGEMLRWLRRRRYLVEQLNAVDGVVFPSSGTRRVLETHLRHDRWRQIPYGLSKEWHEHAKPVTSEVKRPDELIIGFAGSLRHHKGPDLLLDAVHILGWHRTRIRLAGPAGDEAYMQVLRQRAKALNVKFLGALDAPDMPAFYRSLDVFVLTSRWPENLPFVLLEAQASGVPVVAADVAGVSEQVPDAKMRFGPGRADELALAMEYVRTHPGEAVPGVVQTDERMAEQTLAFYDEAVQFGCGSA